jgi:MYXO-CTERM domain-containing protein
MRHIFLALLFIVSLTPHPARAVVVLAETFDVDSDNFAGDSDWTRSFCQDGWRSDLSEGVMAGKDFGCESCGCQFGVWVDGQDECVDSDAFDNHIQAGSRYWQNYIYTVKFKNADDDALGVIFRYYNTATFYLFMVSRDTMPNPASGCDESYFGAKLYRVREDNDVTLLKQSPNVTYEQNKVHQVRVTASGLHIRVEFDLNGDGFFGPEDIFFDQEDIPSKAIIAGSIGLFAYQNGIQESYDAQGPCLTGDCWFDDVSVDLQPPNNADCGDTTWEGKCQGDTLVWCGLNGQIQSDNCGVGQCCKYLDSTGYFTCTPSYQCDQCANSCASGEGGCSANLTHQWVCGQGDQDNCLEPVFEACQGDGVCSPATGECESGCIPDCVGKECGVDGCGGECGQCPAGTECSNGICKAKALGKLGDFCVEAADCTSGICLDTETGDVCSMACMGAVECPEGYNCEQILVDGGMLLVCAPTGGCVGTCAGKECGEDGCGNSCGTCVEGLECKAGQCKHVAGATCQEAGECASSLCIPFQAGTLCSTPCSTNSGCPSGWLCVPWMAPETPNICAPKSSMTAYDSCEEIAHCIDTCPEGNLGCIATCYFMGSESPSGLYAEYSSCALEHCDGCPELQPCDLGCAMDHCFQPFADCFPGSTSCKVALECFGDCESEDAACTDACFDAALPAAKMQMFKLFSCVEPLCGEAPQPGCFSAAASTECKDLFDSCVTSCIEQCDGNTCGNDGCGGSCGDCGVHEKCEDGQCVVFCAPQCDGRECGNDGCGGSCGTCVEELVCIDAKGKCETMDVCIPQAHQQCVGISLYWFDSCANQGELVKECLAGCDDAQCIEDADPAPEDVLGTQVTGETVSFSGPGGKKKSGCGFTTEATGSNLGLWAMMLLAMWLLRRRTERLENE